MFPADCPFSGAVFHGGQISITINTLKKSPGTCEDGSTSTERSYKRIKRILKSSDDEINEKLYYHLAFLKNSIKVMEFIMNIACLKFCRATSLAN